MTGTPRRVTVTGPRIAPAPATQPAVPRARDPLGETAEIPLRQLMRAQLRLGLTTCLSVCGVLALLPVLFALMPVLGAALSWAVLGVAVYPALVAVGWIYVRRAERHEQNFARCR